MYLLDAVVLSELRKKRRDPNVVAWVASVAPDQLFLSTLTVVEVEIGIERQRKENPEFAEELSRWLSAVVATYDDRLLPLTTGVARRWGRLAASVGHKGLDLAIAATALEHGLTVVTRNVSDFAPTGVSVVNPFDRSRGGRR